MRRGLVLAGGGAKGAYQYGALEVFKEHSIHFEAVSGTSVGGLNALIWSIGFPAEADLLWKDLSFERTYPPRPLWKFRKWIAIIANVVWHYFTGLLPPEIDRPIDQWRRRMRIGYVVIATILFVALCVSYPSPGLIGIAIFLLWPFIILSSNRKQAQWLCLLVLFYFSLFLVSGLDKGPVPAPFWIFLRQMLTAGACVATILLILYSFTHITILRPEPLHQMIEQLLSTYALTVPTYVTVAECVDVFDPDHVREVVFGRGHVRLAPNLKFIPRYRLLNEMDRSEQVQACKDTALLPFGLVTGAYGKVDGGLADNVPVYPHVGLCDEVWIIDLDPSSRRTLESERIRWQMVQRLIDLEAIPKPPVDAQVCECHNDPPTVLPLKDAPPNFPRIRVLQPSSPIGGFLDGTLDFSKAYALKAKQLGREDAQAWLLEQGPDISAIKSNA